MIEQKFEKFSHCNYQWALIISIFYKNKNKVANLIKNMASRLSFCTRVLKYVILGNEKMTNYTYYSDRKKTKQSSLLNSKQLK